MSERLQVPHYGHLDREYGLQLAGTPADQDGPIWVFHLVQYRDQPHYPDGSDSEMTGWKLEDTHAPHEQVAAVGGEVVYCGQVDTQFLGDPKWDQVTVTRYPTRRALLSITSKPGFAEAQVHLDAATEREIILGSVPMPNPFAHENLVDWDDVAYPPTQADGPIQTLHLIRFDDTAEGDEARTEMWDPNAVEPAIREGIRVVAWFDIEGTLIGDGRSWDQLRVVTFPSRDSFISTVFDENRLKSHARRVAATADSIHMILRPIFNRLDESIRGDVRG